MTWLAVLLSVGSALVGAVGMVLQQSEAASVGDRGLGLLRAMLARPRWLLGYGLGVLAVALQAWALSVGALLVVQPVGVTSLLFALPLAARFAGRSMTTGQWVHAGVLTAALAAFVLIGRPSDGQPIQPWSSWLVIVGPALGVVVALCLLGRRVRGTRRALLLGLGTGIMFGIQAALSKSVLTIGTSGGVQLRAVATSWELYALLLMAVASVALQQVAFQAAALSASQPAITVMTPISAAVCGVLIFGEGLHTSPAGWVVVAVAVLAMGWATVGLARSSSARPAVRPPMTRPPAVAREPNR
ncbi:DMT family transporter [Microlunatus ginsengisoli]|uniref:DMT family transporter n=1 Tax=Microlunatus ginsengisoli TaxID=363863 RepID=A0ABP7AGD9_9ACTN